MKYILAISIIILIPFTSCTKHECLERKNDNLICTEQYEPVCGCNNVTYSNACYAQRAGASYYTNGACN